MSVKDHSHKKIGLAKLAKAHSLSNGLNNLGLNSVEEDVVNVLVPPNSSVHPSILLISPTPRPPFPEGLPVEEASPASEKSSQNQYHKSQATLRKSSLANLSGTLSASSTRAPTRSDGGKPTVPGAASSPQLTLMSMEQCPQQITHDTELPSESNVVPSSEDKDRKFQESETPFKKSFLQSLNKKSFRRKSVKERSVHDGGDVLLSPTSNQLQVPKKVSRSRSLSRISDVITQVQNVCLLPASTRSDFEEIAQHPLSTSSTSLMVASHPAFFPLTNAFPLNIQNEERKTDSPIPASSNNLTTNNKTRIRLSRSPLKHTVYSSRVAPLNTPSQPSQKFVEKSSRYPTRPGSGSRSRSRKTLKHVPKSDSHLQRYDYNVNRNNVKPKRRKRSKGTKKVTHKDTKNSSSNSPSGISIDSEAVKGSPTASPSSMHMFIKPVLQNCKSYPIDNSSTNRSGRPASWSNFEQQDTFLADEDSSDDDSDCTSMSDTSTSGRQWSSMSQLSGQVAPLGQIRSSEAKQRTYLFGGLGSLLGTTELERYFPDRNVVIFIATWNMNGKEPPESLDDFLLPDDVEHMPDMYVIGTQESGGDRTEWEVRLQTTIGPSHVLFHSAVLGILHLTVFLRRDLVWFCSVPEESYHSLRPGTYFKTKGAIAISFQFFGTKILFVNTHLFAHEEKLLQRIQNYKTIIGNLDIPRNLKKDPMHRSKDVTKRYDVVFWLGDLNFRLVGPRDQILEKIKFCNKTGRDISDLLFFDQLNQSRHKGDIFEDFSEGPIRFAPTFKFDVGTNHYDSSSKQRVPSYTDRILYKSKRDPVKCINYGSCPFIRTSDHKPVWGVFQFKVRPGKDDVPLAAGLFQREIYLTALKRRRRFFHQPSSRNCQMQ